MGRKNKPDEPWLVVPVIDQTPSSTMATETLPAFSAISSATTQTAIIASLTTGAVLTPTGVTLVESSGVDLLTGSLSTTSLSQGSALLVSSNSSNVLVGSSGNDTLMGSHGGTSLIGKEGADLFVVQNTTSLDQVMDFTDGQDKLVLSGVLAFGQLNITQQGQDTLISSQNTPLMLLHNISSNLITAADIA
jgi:Ca2+-binding RTX toxin-like protein